MARKLYPGLTAIHSAIDEAFRSARMFKESHEQLNARLTNIREELNSKTPAGKWRYVEFERFSAEGYISARRDDIWQYLEFCYRDASGVLFSTYTESTHRKTREFYAADRGSELSKLESAHVWKGTDRNYTPWAFCHDSKPHKVTESVE